MPDALLQLRITGIIVLSILEGTQGNFLQLVSSNCCSTAHRLYNFNTWRGIESIFFFVSPGCIRGGGRDMPPRPPPALAPVYHGVMALKPQNKLLDAIVFHYIRCKTTKSHVVLQHSFSPYQLWSFWIVNCGKLQQRQDFLVWWNGRDVCAFLPLLPGSHSLTWEKKTGQTYTQNEHRQSKHLNNSFHDLIFSNIYVSIHMGSNILNLSPLFTCLERLHFYDQKGCF